MKRSIAFLPLVGLSALCGACSDDKADNDQTVTLKILHHNNPAFDKGDEDAAAAYTALHPNVKFEFEQLGFPALAAKLASELPSGKIGADIITMPPSFACTYSQDLAKVPTGVVSLTDAKELFYGAPLEGVICGDELHGFPVEYNLEYGGVAVNMDLYEATFGAGAKPHWKTMDDLIADAEQLSQFDANGKMTVAGLHFMHADAIGSILIAGILQQGGDYWGPDRKTFTFNTPEAVQTIEWMRNAVFNNKVNSPEIWARGPWDTIVDGTSALAYAGTWIIALAAASNAPYRFEYYAHPPIFGETQQFVNNSGWSVTVPAASKHQQQAWDFAKFLTTEADIALGWSLTAGTIPALKANGMSAEISDDAAWGAVLPLLPVGHWQGYMSNPAKVFGDIVSGHVFELLSDPSKDVPETLSKMEAEASATLP